MRDRLCEQLFEVGAAQHRTNQLTALSKRSTSNADVVAITGHLLYEGLLFHHKHFAIAASGLAKRHLWRAACELFSEMRGQDLEPNTIICNIALDGCRRAHEWVQALAMLEDMRSGHLARPDVISYTTAVIACEKGGNWEAALKTFACLLAERLRPDQRCLSAVLSACASGHLWALALDFIANPESLKPPLDVVCYNGAISACAKAMQWTRSLAILASIARHGPAPDAVSYNSAIDACQGAHRWPEAFNLLQAMTARRVVPTVVTYIAAIHACSRAGGAMWAHALQLLSELRCRKLAPTLVTYGALMAAAASAGRWELSHVLLEQMRTEALAPDRSAYGSAVIAHAGPGPLLMAHRVALYREVVRRGLLSPWDASEPGVLDLHGHGVEMALAAVHSVIADLSPRGVPETDLVIITGRGLHGDAGESRLFPALAQFLYEEFSPPLVLRRGSNPGRWVVTAESLKAWLDSNS